MGSTAAGLAARPPPGGAGRRWCLRRTLV